MAPSERLQAKPVLLTVDDDRDVLRAIARDLRQEYGGEYRVFRSNSADEALQTLKGLPPDGDPVALLLVDQRMPGLTGVEFLERAMPLWPDAKRVLLTAYADTDAAIRAINSASIDHYLLKPWDPPEEHLYPVLNDLLNQWQGKYKNKAVVHEFQEAFWNEGQLDAHDRFVSPEGQMDGRHRGRDAMRKQDLEVRTISATAFPDNRFEFEAELVEGDEVVSRWTLRGTHRGIFMGIPPTGRRVALRGTTFFKLANGVIIEVQRYADIESLSRQLRTDQPG